MMEENEILEGNKIVAEFWGYKHYPADKWYKIGGRVEHYFIENTNHEVYGNKTHRISLERMRFHLDWSWLMPVVTRIENLKSEDHGYLYSFNMGRDWCSIETNDFSPTPISSYSIPDNKILSVWKSVVNFIKWYNNKQNGIA